MSLFFLYADMLKALKRYFRLGKISIDKQQAENI